MLVFRFAGAFSLLTLLAGGAQATVLFNNLDTTPLAADPISGDGPQFASFTTDTTGVVNTIQLMLDSLGDSGGVVEVAIYDDAATAPNNLIHTVGFVDESLLGGSLSPFTLTLDETLHPNTRYWIQLTDVSGISSQEWGYAADASGTGVLGEFNGNAGGIFANGDGSDDTTSQPYMMCISNNNLGANGAPDVCAIPPVPEPASLGILGLGLVGLGLLRRWRRAG